MATATLSRDFEREIRRKYGQDVTIRKAGDPRDLTFEVLRGNTPLAIVDHVGRRRGWIKELATGADEVRQFKTPRDEVSNRIRQYATEQFGRDDVQINKLSSRDDYGGFEVSAGDQVLGTIDYDPRTGQSRISGRGQDAGIDYRNRELDKREKEPSRIFLDQQQPTQQAQEQPTQEPQQEPYTIQWGDTLSQLAQTHGTTVQELQRLNPSITDPDRIRAGAKLVLPTVQPTQSNPAIENTMMPVQQTIDPTQQPIDPTLQGQLPQEQAPQFPQQQPIQTPRQQPVQQPPHQPTVFQPENRPMQPNQQIRGSLFDSYLQQTQTALQQAMQSGQDIDRAFKDMYNRDNIINSGAADEMEGVPDLEKNTQKMLETNPVKQIDVSGELNGTGSTTDGEYENEVTKEQNKWIDSLRKQPSNIYTNPAITETYAQISGLFKELLELKNSQYVVRDYIKEKGSGNVSFDILNALAITKSREVDYKIREKQNEIDLTTRILNAQIQLQDRTDRLIRADRQFYADEQNRIRDDLLSGLRYQQGLEQSNREFEQRQYEFSERKWQADRNFMQEVFERNRRFVSDEKQKEFSRLSATYDRVFRQYQQKRKEYEFAVEQPLRQQKLALDMRRLQEEINNFPIEAELKRLGLEYDTARLRYLQSQIGQGGEGSEEDFAKRASKNWSAANQQAVGRKILSLTEEQIVNIADQLGATVPDELRQPLDRKWYVFDDEGKRREKFQALTEQIVSRIGAREQIIRMIMQL